MCKGFKHLNMDINVIHSPHTCNVGSKLNRNCSVPSFVLVDMVTLLDILCSG